MNGLDLIGEGCSYLFFSATRWRSYVGGWEADGDLRWEMPQEARGPRTAEQSIQPPNVFLDAHGKLVRLADDDGSAVGPREWRAVVDDWYDNGCPG